ncbi:hypothetical protein MIDIC_140022 [Alphaproteobacteria bacterium]
MPLVAEGVSGHTYDAHNHLGHEDGIFAACKLDITHACGLYHYY